MAILGKLITALAGRTLARTIGGVTAGPLGAAVGFVLPTAIPMIARRLGPVGMVATAVGSAVFARWLERRATREAGVTAEGKPAARPAGTRNRQTAARAAVGKPAVPAQKTVL